MTTRSGRHFKKGKTAEMATEEGGSVSVAKTMKFMVEGRQRREVEYAAEWERREAEFERHTAEMSKQLMRMVGEGRVEWPREALGERQRVKLKKLSEGDDIEAYLKMLEHIVPRVQWVFKLVPQLTGPAQQAYSALSTAAAADYDKVKEAIWARYDIIELLCSMHGISSHLHFCNIDMILQYLQVLYIATLGLFIL